MDIKKSIEEIEEKYGLAITGEPYESMIKKENSRNPEPDSQ